MLRPMILFVAAALCAPASAQDAYRPGLPPTDSNPAPQKTMCWDGARWRACSAETPIPVGGKQESTALVVGNVARPAATLYGGSYILTQACSAYVGEGLTVSYRGPDGATFVPLVSKTAADAGGGTELTLGSGAVVRATIAAGTTGCEAQIARVP